MVTEPPHGPNEREFTILASCQPVGRFRFCGGTMAELMCRLCSTDDPVGGLSAGGLCKICSGSILGNILELPRAYSDSDYSQTLGLCQALNIIRKDIMDLQRLVVRP